MRAAVIAVIVLLAIAVPLRFARRESKRPTDSVMWELRSTALQPLHHPLSALYHAGQNVITQLRLISESQK